MELMSGYKQTEIGAIPEDWALPHLVDLVDPARGIRYGIVQPGMYDPRGRFMVRGQDYSDGWVDPPDLFRVSASVEERYRNARIRSGDVLITIVGASTGTIAVTPDWLDGANLTQTTARIAISPDKADSAFCAHVLSSWYGSRQVANYIKGGAQPGLNCADIKKFVVPLPTRKREQRAIATALSDVDALLDALDRLSAKKRDLKQAAMQQLLTGQTRLPGFSGEWGLLPFDAVFRKAATKNCQIQTTEYQQSGAYPVIDQGQSAIVGYSDRADKVFRVPDSGVVVFGDHTCIVKFISHDFIVGADGTQVLVPKSEQCARFHAYCLIHRGVEATGYNRHFKFLKERLFQAPALPEQTAIAAALSDMDAEIEALEARRAKTRDLKQAMMQELLTGKTRLVNLNTEVTAAC